MSIFRTGSYRYSNIAVVGGVGGAAGSYIGTNVNTANADPYTFSAEDLGAEHESRVIVVGVVLSHATSGTARTISSATINGVPATIHPSSIQTNVAGAHFISAPVPTGTSGDIVLDLSGTALAARIFKWRLTPASSTAVDAISTANTAGTALNDLEVSTGGWIGIVAAYNDTPRTLSWSGANPLTEDFQGTVETADSTAASANITETGTGFDFTASDTCHMAAVSFR